MLRRSARHAAPSDKVVTDDTLGTIYTNPRPQNDGSTSHFLRLPAELRNVVYSLIFATTSKPEISSFRPPAITQVSKQLRDESLPLFFAETVFRMPVGGNFESTHVERIRRRDRFLGFLLLRPFFHPSQPNHMAMAGVIVARPWPKGTHSKVALFRNVELEVYDTEAMVKGPDGVVDNGSSEIYLVLRLKVKAWGAMELSVEKGKAYPIRHAERSQDVEGTVEKATGIAREIAAAKKFKGFKMKDLQRIATAFRLEE
ncbi:hypothetical protein PRZ48_004555 [Zasmidium cellare]|uniref:F-box domain-containing protein n=1 Tax=Zasmidium cellare TaxID=395010 RepID=A0ABR0ER69_ZASCE|nr:hypothetical protein PRZ48_004555 [Zasmidium cellare]